MHPSCFHVLAIPKPKSNPFSLDLVNKGMPAGFSRLFRLFVSSQITGAVDFPLKHFRD
jgi:hypothetical protein